MSEDMARESDAVSGKMVPLTDWEIQYLYDLLAEERWQWHDRLGLIPTYQQQERLFQKLADNGAEDE